MSGILYSSYKDALGFDHQDEPIATFENGKVYLASDGFLGTVAKGTLIGEYENGNIFSVGGFSNNRQNYIGVVENGRVYEIESGIAGGYTKSLQRGECSDGNVYFSNKGVVGKYSGDVEGAAAAAAILLMGFASKVSAYEANNSNSSNNSDNSPQQQNSVIKGIGGGCSGWMAFAGLFLVCCCVLFLADNVEYLSIIFLCLVPLVFLVVKLLRVIFFSKGKTVKFSIGGGVKSALIMFVYTLCAVGFLFSFMKGNQVLNVDFAIVIGFVLAIINGVFSIK